jgi:hypothetical protein
MFYLLQSRPKLDYIVSIEINVLCPKIESHDVLYLFWGLVRYVLSNCIIDRKRTSILLSVECQLIVSDDSEEKIRPLKSGNR